MTGLSVVKVKENHSNQNIQKNKCTVFSKTRSTLVDGGLRGQLHVKVLQGKYEAKLKFS